LEDYNNSIKWYTKIIADDDSDKDEQLECLYGRARSYFELNNYPLAEKDLKVLLGSSSTNLNTQIQNLYKQIKQKLAEEKSKMEVVDEEKKEEDNENLKTVKATETTKKIDKPIPVLTEKNKSSKTYRDTWTQDGHSATLTIYCKNLTEEQIQTYFVTNDKVIIDININENDEMKIYRRIINLTEKININESKMVLTKYKVNMKLKKQVPKHWLTYEQEEIIKKIEKEKQLDKLLADEDEDDMEDGLTNPASKVTDPQSSIMDLMKKMYNDGDDNMKQLIKKSWTEAQDKKKSGGGPL